MNYVCVLTTDAVDGQPDMVPSTLDGSAASLRSHLQLLSSTALFSVQHFAREAGRMSGLWSAGVLSGLML